MRLRTIGRALLAPPAAGFAILAYVYLTLPDVRPLKTQNPTTTAFMTLREQEPATAESPRVTCSDG